MTEKSFQNELQRALARPDVQELKNVLTTYHDWNARGGSEKDWSDELDTWFDADQDPDRGLALVMLAAATYDEREFLAVVSAGLLENLLQKPSGETLRRIISEARKTARVRWMLDVPFRHAIHPPDVRSAIDKAVGDMDCEGPRPPRPWA